MSLPETIQWCEEHNAESVENHDRECFCRLCGFSWVVPPSGVATPLELESRGGRKDVA